MPYLYPTVLYPTVLRISPARVGYSPQEGLECELPPAITAAFCTGTLSALRSAAMRGADSSSGSGGALLDLTSRCMHTSQALALRYMYLR